ncbi:hypothetical protein Emed_000327 [Eimeria media]
MGPRTLRASVGMSLLLVGVSWDSTASAAPWNNGSSSSSSSGGSSSLEAILHNAGLEVPPTQSLSAPPEPAHNAFDLFSVGAWLGAPLGLASQPLASYPSEMSRRLRPQPQVELPGIDRSQQWLASLPGLGLMSSTAQLQRQQPHQEKELAAAAARLANSVKTVRLTLTPSQRKAVETMIYALQTIRIESNRSVLSDYDRAVINQLTATASKSVEEVERFLNSYSELLTRLSSLGRALQSLSPPWEYTPSAPLAVAAADLHAAATDAAAAVDPDQEQPQQTSSSSTTTTTTTTTVIPTTTSDVEDTAASSTLAAPPAAAAAAAAAGADATNTDQAAPAAAAEESQETSFATPPPQQPAARSTAATTTARGGRQRNRRPSNAAESSSSSSSTTTTTTTTTTSTSTADPIDADEQEDEQQLQEQQLQEQQLVKEVQQQLQEQQLQEQQLQQLQLQMQMQQQLQEQQQMQMQLQEQLHEQQQLQELQQLQQQYEEEENWRKVQQQRLQQMLASEEAAAMARLRALLRSNTYADLRAAVGPYGPPVSLREAMAFKEFGDKLKVKGWGAGEIRRAAKKTSSTTEAFYAVAREVGLSKASVDALAPRMPMLLK